MNRFRDCTYSGIFTQRMSSPLGTVYLSPAFPLLSSYLNPTSNRMSEFDASSRALGIGFSRSSLWRVEFVRRYAIHQAFDVLFRPADVIYGALRHDCNAIVGRHYQVSRPHGVTADVDVRLAVRSEACTGIIRQDQKPSAQSWQ